MAEQQNSKDGISPAKKVALVIAALGAENASYVYKHLSDDEVETLSVELARLDYQPIEVVEEVLNEFYELCLTQKVVTEGGVDYARSILERRSVRRLRIRCLTESRNSCRPNRSISLERRTIRTCLLSCRTSIRRQLR